MQREENLLREIRSQNTTQNYTISDLKRKKNAEAAAKSKVCSLICTMLIKAEGKTSPAKLLINMKKGYR